MGTELSQQRLLFEFSPWWIPACMAVGALYAWVMYQTQHPWSKAVNRRLMAGRAVFVSVLAFLLLGPLLKLIYNELEKPVWVLLVDDSRSVGEALPARAISELKTTLAALPPALEAAGYAVETRTLSGNDSLLFTHPSSGLSGALSEVMSDYEGRNLAGIVLVSDGLYNQGSSPLYLDYRAPVVTVGVGDTLVRPDLAIRHVAYNKVVYQGNRFPVRAEILAAGAPEADVTVRIKQGERVVASQSKPAGGGPLFVFDFEVEAGESGLQSLGVEVLPLAGERNTRNNRYTLFFEVADGKKNILLLAPGPHPDIRALASVAGSQPNYNWQLYIPGVTGTPPDPAGGNFDLIIVHQALQGNMAPWLRQARKSGAGVWIIAGAETPAQAFQANDLPVAFENTLQQDEATPVLNPAFRDFAFSETVGERMARYPPVQVPFGKFTFPPEAQVLLYQRIGSVATTRPLLFTWNENEAKRALLLAEGLWRWRLHEFRETENTDAFNEWVGKLIQFLSTREDKSRFRCFPLRTEFAGHEPVVFESQLYNELLEQIYGNAVELEITNAQRQTTRYNYTTRAGNTRYTIGTLREGVYRYRAATTWKGATETATGQFIVNEQSLEQLQTTADFSLLRRLSEKTGGRFYTLTAAAAIPDYVAATPAKSMVHSSETFQSLLNTPWLFALLLIWIAAEWVTRKYLGGY
jgi:hypothetical protein